ncbi:MAG: PEP-CTERM sorting domain-containing protein [Aquabacterium sp.]|uniref:PEP-CTERM sorting domain-containing protein n=1 Tax=Aquabacterium sp. TaxID=1872578 RepID=UPI00271A6639|nr:PEP-CTERM sorting domain-containing protein [Aquabacterium sp.]MDO9004452.1 PEP-CTERM sorting domain-containing protein [Aquabacterium sp.]
MKKVQCLKMSALTFAMLAGAVHANTGTAYSRFTNLSLAAVDLTPGDGVAASFEVLASGGSTRVLYSQYYATRDGQSSNAFLANTSVSGAGYLAQTTATSLQTSVSGSGTIEDGAWAMVRPNVYNGNIRLAPNTMLLISADIELSAQVNCTESQLTCSASSAAYVEVRRDNYQTSSPYSGIASYYKGISANASTASNSYTDTARIAYVNYSNEYQNLGVTLTSNSQVSLNSGNVPEPSAYLLVAAGLGMVAWRARARQSRVV